MWVRAVVVRVRQMTDYALKSLSPKWENLESSVKKVRIRSGRCPLRIGPVLTWGIESTETEDSEREAEPDKDLNIAETSSAARNLRVRVCALFENTWVVHNF